MVVLASCAQPVPAEAFDEALVETTIAFAEETFVGQTEGRRFRDATPAELWTRYDVEIANIEEAFDDIVAQATADGWELESTIYDGLGSYTGEKDGASYHLELNFAENEFSDETHTLTVFLRTGDVPG